MFMKTIVLCICMLGNMSVLVCMWYVILCLLCIYVCFMYLIHYT